MSRYRVRFSWRRIFLFLALGGLSISGGAVIPDAPTDADCEKILLELTPFWVAYDRANGITKFTKSQRKTFLTQVRDGRLFQAGNAIESSSDPQVETLFTLGPRKGLYVLERGLHEEEKNRHSSPVKNKVTGVGTLKMRHGEVLEMSNHAGHYAPDIFALKQTLDIFGERGIDTRHTVLAIYGLPRSLTYGPYFISAADFRKAFPDPGTKPSEQLAALFAVNSNPEYRGQMALEVFADRSQPTSEKVADSLADFFRRDEAGAASELARLERSDPWRADLLYLRLFLRRDPELTRVLLGSLRSGLRSESRDQIIERLVSEIDLPTVRPQLESILENRRRTLRRPR